MVKKLLTMFVGSPETPERYLGSMDAPFINGRLALDDASDLIERFGTSAIFEASVRAERSRDDGNLARFCHWRQIERVIVTLTSDEAVGTIH